MKEALTPDTIERIKQMINETSSIYHKLQNARKEIATPYVFALQKQFPNTETYDLIRVADEDLQRSNEHYRRITEKLVELQEFNNGDFQDLVRLVR